MNTNKLIITFLFCISLFSLSAQESIKIMQYNLLYYGRNTTFCTATNNNIDYKNSQLKTILDYVQPDIFCVNEIDASLTDVNYLMNNALNVDGVTHWRHAAVAGSYLTNMLYYNSDKINLVSQEAILGSPRNTNVYHLELVSNPEVKWTVFVVHLKAGSSYDNELDRSNSTESIMDYLQARDIQNYMISGDFNVYSSSEGCFQNLVNPSNPNIAFNDPIDRLGTWSNNSSFSDVHTQSTHSNNQGCFSYGGIDDRFDFILISNAIKNGTQQIQYQNNSYETIGQDGNHYNQSINSGINNSAPSEVISALYEMSDHLPVSLNLNIGGSPVPVTNIFFNKDFDDQDLTSGGWTSFSVTDDQKVWNIPSENYGHNSTYCAKISGWDNANYNAVDNEDWLISPAFNADENTDMKLNFWSACKHDGSDLEVFYSNDYSGTGNPNNANWTAFSNYELSSGNYLWHFSGNIDLSDLSGENVYIGFKYTSSPDLGARTWELDDIMLTGVTGINNIENLVRFSIYPNPVSSNLHLNITSSNISNASSVIEIYSTVGILLDAIELTGDQMNIDVSHLEEGIYFVKVENTVHRFLVLK